MFELLPTELELLIFRKYFTMTLLPELKEHFEKKSLDVLKEYFTEVVLYGVEYKAISLKVAKLLNSVIDQNIIYDVDTEIKLDKMYYEIFNLHVKKKYDIFV